MNKTETTSAHTLSTLNSSIFLLSQPFFMLGMLLPIFGREAGANAVEIGLIFSAFSVMTILMRPIVGWALDHFGRRPFYVIGMLGYAVTMVGFAYSQDVLGMIIMRLLQGASSACVWPATMNTVNLFDISFSLLPFFVIVFIFASFPIACH